jgi:hypothetical protein
MKIILVKKEDRGTTLEDVVTVPKGEVKNVMN